MPAASCPCCGTPRHLPRATVVGSPTYLRCATCAHQSLWPMPSDEELAAYYNAQYRVPRELQRQAAERGVAWLREALTHRTPEPGLLLEIGCSYGDVLGAFAAEGWRTIGLEMDARAASIARAEGRHVLAGAVPAALPDVQADVVVASHVLEHLPAPREALEAVATRLVPDGLLVLRTPNVRSLAARTLGNSWEWSAVPEHVQLFSPSSLERLLVGLGLQIVSLSTARGDAHPLVVELALGTWRALRGRAAGGGQSGADHAYVPPTHRPAFRRAAQAVGVVQRPLDVWLSAVRQGEELRVIARKVSPSSARAH